MISDTRPVLITGGAGFVGCNIADALLHRGQRVIILDDLSRPGSQKNLWWLQHNHGDKVWFVPGNVSDLKILNHMVPKASAVLHLAAQVAVTTSLEAPRADFETNILGTLNVLEAVRQHNPKAPVVFASTNKVYGRLVPDEQVRQAGERYQMYHPLFRDGVSERAPLDFHSPYGCSKGAADQYVLDYARSYGLRTAVLRMSCIYGQRQNGNEDQGWVAHFVRQALQREPITIFGDGRQVRDLLYIDDAVAAWLAVLDNIDKVRGEVFNLGGGMANSVSLLELIKLLEKLTRHEIDTGYKPWREGDQRWYVSDTGKLERALAWEPRVEPREGVARLAQWMNQSLNLHLNIPLNAPVS